MKILKILIILIIIQNIAKAQEDFFLSEEFVDLRGRSTATIIKNSTKDTLKLSGRFKTWLPIQSNSFESRIAPGGIDTLSFNFAYPDFIYFESPISFRIFNSPGKILHCDILSLSPGPININFSGAMASVNDYYLSSDFVLGKNINDFQPFFLIADTIKTFNDFPKVVDSINNKFLSFLFKYNRPLPTWFKNHEKWRLNYLVGDVKLSGLHSKELFSDKIISVDKHFFNFQRNLPLNNKEMILNTEYLFYIEGIWGKILNLDTVPKLKDKYSLSMELIDSLWGQTDLGDIFKMRILSNMDSDAREVYTNTNFYNSKTKIIFDSLINAKCGVPKVGTPCPDLILKDIHGNNVSISNFRGNTIIVNFWSSSCRGCIIEFPYENKLYKKYKDKGLAVINICLDTDVDDWKELSKRKDLQMVNLFAFLEKNMSIKQKFNINAYPKSILIGPDFSVLDNNFKRTSLLSEEDIKKILNKGK